MTPKRIQLRRTKGWRKPEGAVVVARPTKWGNPYLIVADDSGERVGWWVSGPGHPPEFAATLTDARQIAVDAFADHAIDQPWWLDLHELRGKDLACWCPLDQPCHADVLLDLANPEVRP